MSYNKTRPTQCQVVFVIGAPRSGTTWIQQMLGAHPKIVTSQETDLFNTYVEPVWRSWNEDLRTTSERRFKGLAAVLTQEDFDDWIGDLIAAVHQKLLALKPSASVVLEKNPPYSLHINLITRFLPAARFIHVLRDGRDVVASLVAASRGWGRSWAPKKVMRAAKTWRRYVEGAREACRLGKPYIEVRYEDLLRQGASELKRLFEFCDVSTTLEECSAIYDRFTFDKMKSQQNFTSSIVWSGEIERRHGLDLREPEGFFREGKAGIWKEFLSRRECRRITKVAGDLLADLGYIGNDEKPIRFFKYLPLSLQTALGRRKRLRKRKT